MSENSSTAPIKRKFGGPQPGSGRPKGKKNKATLERDAVNRMVQQRLMRAADKIVHAQIGLGIGSQYLYRIDKEFVRTGTNKKTGEAIGFYKKLKPVQVTSQLELEAYLEGTCNEGDADDENDPAAAYYFLTTKDPENSAIDSMFNRALGKPKDVVEHTGNITFSLLKLAQQAEDIEKLKKPDNLTLKSAN